MSAEFGSLELCVEQREAGVVVHVRGEVNLYESDRLRAELKRLVHQRVEQIVLDLAEMTFICSDGLGAIISAHIQCRHHAGRISLVSPCPAVGAMLDATRLSELFPVRDSVDEALSS